MCKTKLNNSKLFGGEELCRNKRPFSIFCFLSLEFLKNPYSGTHCRATKPLMLRVKIQSKIQAGNKKKRCNDFVIVCIDCIEIDKRFLI